MATFGADDSKALHVVEELTTSLEDLNVHDEASGADSVTIPEKNASSCLPMRIYTRPQLLFLSNSSLVQLPPGMPELKDWFGSENEQNLSKKDSDPTTPGSARERRFRRDMEDGGKFLLPLFMIVSELITQKRPHVPPSGRLFLNLRKWEISNTNLCVRVTLSDKYDRDRLALPLSARTKERESAPHLSTGLSSRTGAQTQIPAGSSRRSDTRDVMKKKAGEASEDWRKGLDSRTTRDERTDSGRKDRDERAKSRVRDSSRPRRETSPSRRELEREIEDDSRRWRDDGKRDERIAARRTGGHGERLREKDVVLDPADRRWVASEDRDNRMKRSGGRDRKLGALADEGKDRDERRERDREREKEPAWMDTYVPSSPSAGILGGKPGDGELDGIQVWKKERKEKELKDKVDASSVTGDAGSTQEPLQKPDGNGSSLDEIQLFRLLMKREEEKKQTDGPEDDSQTNVADFEKSAAIRAHSPLPPNGASVHETTLFPGPPNGNTRTSSTQPSPRPEARSLTAPTLLSLIGAKEPTSISASQVLSDAPNKSHFDAINTLPTTEPSSQNAEIFRDATPQFNPPPGSRLAFARAPRPQNPSSNVTLNGAPQNLGLHQQEFSQPVPSKPGSLRSMPGFSPFDEQGRPSHGIEESSSLVIPPDANRRTTGEHHVFIPSNEHPQFVDSTPPDPGNGFSATKGSRFAKFFDAKGREGTVTMLKTPAGLAPSSPGPGNQRQEHSFNTQGNGPDPRAMDEIYAMLSSSAQGSRGAPIHPNATPVSNNGGFGLQPPNNLHLLQQHQVQQAQQQQHIHANRLEPLYESPLDDRSFVPDGMVPGLRSVPPPRSRDNPSIYENLEEIPFNIQQRHQQQRTFQQLYSGGPPPLYGQQGGRNPGIPLQPNHYRGGPSPLSHQQNHIPSSQQRLPPGLANLGGRPPHEPSQILGMPGMPNTGLHGALHLNGSNPQQPFNSFPPGGNLGYGGGPPIRGPHQLHNQGTHLPMGGHPNNLDMRATGQNQLVGMGGVGGLRGAGAFFPGQQAPSGQMPQLLPMRQQQQQQQLPPHMMTHVLPPHMQHHGPNSSQPAQDLITLLMGGSHRE
ncbi:hypothetical protein C0991_000047 [Blastosporella zonata]|nr:hypothetical protein C0991_000047 [Blastosporella zonata]